MQNQEPAIQVALKTPVGAEATYIKEVLYNSFDNYVKGCEDFCDVSSPFHAKVTQDEQGIAIQFFTPTVNQSLSKFLSDLATTLSSQLEAFEGEPSENRVVGLSLTIFFGSDSSKENEFLTGLTFSPVSKEQAFSSGVTFYFSFTDQSSLERAVSGIRAIYESAEIIPSSSKKLEAGKVGIFGETSAAAKGDSPKKEDSPTNGHSDAPPVTSSGS